MEFFSTLFHHFWSFVVVLSVIVFVHEFGHYLVAKLCGVKVEAFSIGFGRELCGINDRSGTRWKIALLPLGGYVKMYGDASEASTADTETLDQMTEAEKRLTFHHKPLWRKAAIVAAGPGFNFLLTIAVLTWFIMTTGLASVEPVIGAVAPNSPAAHAGLQAGDRVLQIDAKKIRRFNDIPYYISTNLGKEMTLHIQRSGAAIAISITPELTEEDDGLGNKMRMPRIGIKSKDIVYEEVGLIAAVGEATTRTYLICESTLHVMGQMITGQRNVDELKGPVGIAQLSGQATEQNLRTVLWLIAMLSANLGLVNLLPIPMLDGGHLLFYTLEALRGRPLARRVQEWSFRVGTALLITLMAFTLLNDISKLIF